MSCEERRDLLLLYAAGELELPAREDLRAHLDAGCPACAGSLAEAEATLAHLPLTLTPVIPPAHVRERLMTRISAAGSSATPSIRPADLARRRPTLVEAWGRPALAAGLAAVVTYVAVSIPAQRKEQAFETEIARQAARIRELSSAVAGAETTLRVLRSPAVDVVQLAGQGPQPGARGRIFWDRSRAEWHFYASDLRPAGPGRTYELWFIDQTQTKIPAGTFDVDAFGEGTLLVQVPAGIGPLALAAVTDEPAGGSPQPTGSIHLAGAVPAAG